MIRHSSRFGPAVAQYRRPICLRAERLARPLGVSTSTAVQRSARGALAQIGTERYVSRVELAAIMGVSLATVDRMVAEGMPSVTWGRRTRRFRASVAIAWAEDRGRA
jgi:hypothetical protein